MEKIAVFMLIDIRLQASSRISMRNRCVYDAWVYFSQYYADVLYRNVTIENVSTTPKESIWAIMGRRYAPLSFQFQFALKLFNTSGSVNEILAFTQIICCVDVHDAQKRIWYAFIFIAKNVWIFHTPSCIHFTETECSDVWSSSR